MLGKSFGAGARQNNKEQRPSRQRLTWINGTPAVQDVRLLLAEAEKNRGILCELPIRGAHGVFLLSCQSDNLSSEPCWTMYEGEDGSKQLWSYIDGNTDMISELACMSVLDKSSKTSVQLPGSETAAAAATQASAPVTTEVAAPAANEAFAQALQGGQTWANPSAPGAQTWADPSAQSGQAWGNPAAQGQVWDNAPTTAQPGWGNQGMPASQFASGNQGMPASQFASGNQGMPASQPGWAAATAPENNASLTNPFGTPATQFPAYSPQGTPAPAQPVYNPYEQQPPTTADPAAAYNPWGNQSTQAPFMPAASAPAPAPAPAAGDSPWRTSNPPSHAASGSMEQFAKSLEGRTNVTIAELAMDPLLPPACVNAALKLQEMVLTGHFGESIAVQALRLAALNNGRLDDSIITKARASAGMDPSEQARQAASILQHAGLLTDTDMAQAEAQMSANDNSFSAALISSGKVDKLVLEAAQDCHTMIAQGRLRQDQAIIALHYCARSRTKLADALQDLSIDVI